jgi:hypothetical protein
MTEVIANAYSFARPRLQVVNDPAGLLSRGLLQAEPLSWNITLQHSAG